MVDTLLGDLMVNVQNLAEVASKLGKGLVPIRHQQMMEMTAVNWGQVILPGNVILRNVLVRSYTSLPLP